MGMFTSIIHPVDGRELQIKCGYDDCETYHVGDTVNWYVNKSWPKSGKLLDDVYDSYSNNGPDCWVVIKDHIVVAVVSSDRDYDSIKEEYQVKDLPDSEWPDEAWERQRQLEDSTKEKWAEYEKSISHLSGKERFAAIFAYPLRQNLNYESIARSMFKISPIEEECLDKIKINLLIDTKDNNDKTK